MLERFWSEGWWRQFGVEDGFTDTQPNGLSTAFLMQAWSDSGCGGAGLDTGVILIRNSDWSRQFVEEALTYLTDEAKQVCNHYIPSIDQEAAVTSCSGRRIVGRRLACHLPAAAHCAQGLSAPQAHETRGGGPHRGCWVAGAAAHDCAACVQETMKATLKTWEPLLYEQNAVALLLQSPANLQRTAFEGGYCINCPWAHGHLSKLPFLKRFSECSFCTGTRNSREVKSRPHAAAPFRPPPPCSPPTPLLDQLRFPVSPQSTSVTKFCLILR